MCAHVSRAQAVIGPKWLELLKFDLKALADFVVGTRVVELSVDASGIRTRISETNQCIVKIACPANHKVFTTAAVLLHQPDCNGDYTALMRFPCQSNSCAVDWTK